MVKRIVAVNESGRRIGESHPRAKLSDHEIDLIRQLAEEGLTVAQIARKFEISKGAAGDIITCRRRAQTPARFKRVG